MRRRTRSRRAPTAVIARVAAVVTVVAALAGCAGSSNTTSSSAGASSPPSATSPPATSTTTGSATSTTTGSATTPQGGPSALSVSPAVASKQSVIRFSFASPTAGAAQSALQTSSALSIVGPHAAGCVGGHNEAVPSEPGQTVNVAVGPAQLGGPWCVGTYTARVEVVQRPTCSQGMMCPQFIRVVAVLGPVTFRISG